MVNQQNNVHNFHAGEVALLTLAILGNFTNKKDKSKIGFVIT